MELLQFMFGTPEAFLATCIIGSAIMKFIYEIIDRFFKHRETMKNGYPENDKTVKIEKNYTHSDTNYKSDSKI